ncbi:coiled-coil and C2 domain-containing protein 1-like isoform X2 [Cydia pomonella]|uniref:coiled-coil and C2 domain-containing protein 1-like isoform X2 n=1 Tax=Cydia pomonella TaxID=82600 RepID=UPI002ADD4376|nr:coiled-coil and C2 domain-containing protein 1-like isoform X2 [Cydia pomonella]
MFRKPQKPSSGKKPNLSQFGLLDIDPVDDDDEPMDGSDDDMDLEAELAAISGGGARHRPRKPAPVPAADLDAMIAASLQDIPSDDEGSGDDDDPELLSELHDLSLDEAPAPQAPLPRVASADSSTISLLQDRITNYTVAEKNAKAAGESSRARRFGRGLKTLNDLLKQAKAGATIANDDIPPPVAVGKPAPAAPALAPAAPAAPEPAAEPRAPTRPAPAIPDSPSSPPPSGPPPPLPAPRPPAPPPRAASLRSPAQPGPPALDPARQEGLQTILKRKKEFIAAARAAKPTDMPLALEYLKVVKQFDVVADAWKSGQEMDLNELPTPEAIAAGFKAQQKGEDQTQGATEAPPEASAPEEAPALITATTMAEALKQRLAGFQEQEAKAKEQGNSSKARRMGRIVKQYQEAIKLHAAGKPVPVDELPPIAGYGPIPTDSSPAPAPAPAARPAAPAPPAAPAARQASRYDKQLALLLHRQKEFREAALKAKKAGNIEQAKEYLRAAKGFDAVIDAAKGGLAVDLKSLPLPPTAKKQLEHTFDVVTAEDCTPPAAEPPAGSDAAVLARLQQQLAGQLQLCHASRDHYRAMGNIAEMNRFEHLAVTVKQDLDVVVVAKSLNQNPPKFHYESRQFAVVQCNTDLNENDLELTIVRGIAYNVPNPKEVDTYVKFEFPYPQDAPVVDRTAQVKDTNNPEYNAVFPLAIQRAARPCLRVFKRHGVKFEVYSKGGWFSRDALLGACAVKLAPLETQVTIHEAFPLMDGRRPAGGSLEVKLRVRTPLLQQQIQSTTHRWLVIDS